MSPQSPSSRFNDMDVQRQAGSDFSGTVYRACVIASGLATLSFPASPTGKILGVTQNGPAVGEIGIVRTFGITKATVGAGGVTAGDRLEVTTTGAVVVWTAGSKYVGVALETVAAGQTTSILLSKQGIS